MQIFEKSSQKSIYLRDQQTQTMKTMSVALVFVTEKFHVECKVPYDPIAYVYHDRMILFLVLRKKGRIQVSKNFKAAPDSRDDNHLMENRHYIMISSRASP